MVKQSERREIREAMDYDAQFDLRDISSINCDAGDHINAGSALRTGRYERD